MKRSMRDVVSGELSLEYFARRFQEGWKVASIEWTQNTTSEDAPGEATELLGGLATMPYGLQLGAGGFLEESPLEAAVLLLILDQVVREKRIQEIAGELNRQGYSTRDGKAWGATDVFNLMPRLIEAGPSLLKSAGWQQLRTATERTAEKPN